MSRYFLVSQSAESQKMNLLATSSQRKYLARIVFDYFLNQ